MLLIARNLKEVCHRKLSRMLALTALPFFGLLTVIGIGTFSDSLLASEQSFPARAEAVNGKPYGVGVIEISRERALKAGWFSDQTIEVKSTQSTIWLPAVKERKKASLGQAAEQANSEDQLLVYFIYSGYFPAKVQIAIAGTVQSTATLKAHSELRQDVRQRLMQKKGSKPTQIHLHAGGIEDAAIAPYIHAYSYCDARQRSAANAAWLTRWTIGLRAAPEGFRTSLEKALHGKMKCPLGGQFVLQNKPRSTLLWTSSAWRETSLASVTDVPREYRFPFLNWLKNLELNFNLTTTSLNSEIVLDVATNSNKDSGTSNSLR